MNGIRDDPPPTAYVDEFEDDVVSVRVRYWLDSDLRDVLAIRSTYARAARAHLES